MTTTLVSSQHPVVVIGAGLAGWTTVREFRKLDAATPVLLITADSGDFYAKPSLSNVFAQGRTPAQQDGELSRMSMSSLEQAWLDHVRLSSVRLARGCSGSFISANGLVLTNHHCVRECLDQLSTPKDDFVARGFSAKADSDERQCPAMEVKFLDRAIRHEEEFVGPGYDPHIYGGDFGESFDFLPRS